jgi:hypothetical protein
MKRRIFTTGFRPGPGVRLHNKAVALSWPVKELDGARPEQKESQSMEAVADRLLGGMPDASPAAAPIPPVLLHSPLARAGSLFPMSFRSRDRDFRYQESMIWMQYLNLHNQEPCRFGETLCISNK